MALKREPRLSDEDRKLLRIAVMSADLKNADSVIDLIWSKLEGDMQDRINALIYAAKVVVEQADRGIDPAILKAALKDLEGREVAATSTKQLKEGPWYGH